MGVPPDSCEGWNRADMEEQQMKQSGVEGREQPEGSAAPPQGSPPLEATSQSTLTGVHAGLLEVVGHWTRLSLIVYGSEDPGVCMHGMGGCMHIVSLACGSSALACLTGNSILCCMIP